MYMAMLAGGMMIKKLVKRSFTRPEGQGVNCFAFRVKSNKTLRDKLKDAINTTSRDEETTKLLLTESVNCFKMNNQVVRSLEGTGNHVMNFILKWTIIVSLIFVKFGSVVQCAVNGDVLVRSTLPGAGKPARFNVGGDLNIMRLENTMQTVIGVGGKEHDLNLWSLETQQVLFKAKNAPHDKLNMRVPVWIKDLQFLSVPGNSNGHRVIVGTGHRHVRIYDSNTKRRPVQQLENFGENPIQSLCASPDETRVYIGDTAGNLDILDLRTLKHMGRCTGPVGSIRDLACHPTLPYIAAVGLDRMVHVFDVNTRKYRHTIYAKQRLNSVLFCSDGLKDLPVADDEPARKKHKAGDDEIDFADDDEEEEEEEVYEGLEISEDDDDDNDYDDDEDPVDDSG
ncbi:unnamed protein product [Peronospora belbahrii]|uniref:Anaphase-promoting complex subunit 4 WD40 domain-containing protein n=1 Tax=Peronospora belbahrii TaxID=622444 RepID=A0AAU9L211_9STRA|nr:unnamed protein product [Peronospora belbahrii]